MRILGVDDDPTARELVVTTLRVAGYEDVTTAPSALAALARVAEAREPFECFLLDIQMPGVDGIELCRQLRAIEAHRHSPILMITGVTDRASMDRAFAAGATDYVNKPFDPMELVVRIGIAERSCRQQAAVEASQSQIDFLRSRSGLGQRPDLEEAFGISGISTMVGALEMENHLLKMPRLRAWQARTYTIRIEAVDLLHARMSGEAFYDLVADVGDAIAAALKPWPHMVSYLGSGEFSAVIQGSFRPRPDVLRDAVQAQVNAMGVVAGEGAGQAVAIGVDGAMPVSALLATLSERTLVARH